MARDSSSVVHVQPVVGLAWLIANWQFALTTFLLALLPAYWIIQRWRQSQQQARALFDFTLAETLRKQGKTKASVVQYDKVLKHSCPDQLVWRCYSGRSMSLLTRGDAALALIDATKAIELAEAQQLRSIALADKLKVAAAAATVSTTSTSSSSSTIAGVPMNSSLSENPDLDPFLSLPSISLALLLHNRGLIFESLPGIVNRQQAQLDFARAAELEPNLAFCVGQKQLREMQERINIIQKQQQEGKEEQEQQQEGVKGGKAEEGTSRSNKKP